MMFVFLVGAACGAALLLLVQKVMDDRRPGLPPHLRKLDVELDSTWRKFKKLYPPEDDR